MNATEFGVDLSWFLGGSLKFLTVPEEKQWNDSRRTVRSDFSHDANNDHRTT